MKKTVLILLALMLAGTMVSAQSAGDFGLVYRFDPAPQVWPNLANPEIKPAYNIQNAQGLGIIYHFTDQVAIYPTLIFGAVSTSMEREPDVGDSVDLYEQSFILFGLEIDLPIYLKRVDNVSVFFAPGLRIASGVDDFEDKTNTDPDVVTKLFEFGGSVKFGAQATFNRFAVFSSYGLRFDFVKLTKEYENFDDVGKGPAFGTTQLSIGLIYYVGGDS